MPDWTVSWSGSLHRQDEARHSLCGAWMPIRGSLLLDAAPGHRDYPSKQEIAQANLEPADDTWRTTQPKPAPKSPRPSPKGVTCRNCGRRYKTRIISPQQRLCPSCRGGNGKKAV